MPMEWVGPLISGAALVLVAIIEAVAAHEKYIFSRVSEVARQLYTNQA